MIAWLTHLWRLLTAVTLYRKVEAELDVAPPPLRLAAETFVPDHEVLVEAPADLAPHEQPSPAPLAISAAAAISPLPTLAIDVDGWLVGDQVVRVPTKRSGYRWRTKSGKPAGALWHWTATSHGTALAMVRRTATGSGGSVHFWIEHDGTIYQSVPLTRGAGHAGGPTSTRVKMIAGALVKVARNESSFSVNSYLIGTEIVCVGEVRLVRKTATGWDKAKLGDVDAVWMGWPFGKKDKATGKLRKGPIVPSVEVVDAKDRDGVLRFYQSFTPRQLEAVERLARAFRHEYGHSDKALSWGHIDVDPTRKSDPGPLMQNVWLPAILRKLSPP